MPTEFISLAFPNASSELDPIPGAGVDPDYLKRYATNLDDYDFNYTLQPYGSDSFDPFTTGATIAAVTKKLKVDFSIFFLFPFFPMPVVMEGEGIMMMAWVQGKTKIK